MRTSAAASSSRRWRARSPTCARWPATCRLTRPTIQQAKRTEFYSLGLVLGYSYAGSPVIQPSACPDPGADTTSYTPSADPGARLPHAWLPGGSSLYDQLGTGFTLVGPVRGSPDAVAELAGRARQRGIPLTACEPPEDYPWREEFLLVRPDQHIAWRAADPAGIDLDVVTGRASLAERAGRGELNVPGG